MTLERVRGVANVLGLRFDVPVITVAGTNGKGSTCAMLETIALQAGYHAGLYIKPHLVHFEERCRIGGRSVDAATLLPHFAAVEAARRELTLTYFEFTTLAIMRALAAAPLDVVILEVGLGGRYDAVNTIDTDCALITSIDIDHVEYLGPDRESIGREKAQVMRPGRPAVIGDPVPPQSVRARKRKRPSKRNGWPRGKSSNKPWWRSCKRTRRSASACCKRRMAPAKQTIVCGRKCWNRSDRHSRSCMVCMGEGRS